MLNSLVCVGPNMHALSVARYHWTAHMSAAIIVHGVASLAPLRAVRGTGAYGLSPLEHVLQ
jgi:hypothetical protein